MTETSGKQLLHLVFGGELTSLDSLDFKDLSKLDIVGVYPNYATAHAAWKAQGAGDRRQRAYALLHRASAPPARPAGRLTIRSMGLLKRITRSRAVQEALGFAVARYLGLVRRTNRFVMEPADAYERDRPGDAGDRGHVARSAFHDPLREAAGRTAQRVSFRARETANSTRSRCGISGCGRSAGRAPGDATSRQGRRGGAAGMLGPLATARWWCSRPTSPRYPASADWGSSRWRNSRDGRSCRSPS